MNTLSHRIRIVPLLAVLAACAFPAVGAAAATSLAPTAWMHTRVAAGPSFGVAEDASKYAADGGTAIYGSLGQLGMTQDRWTLTFNGDPSAIVDRGFLDKAVPAANAAGVHITLSLFPASAAAPDPTAFCTWALNVAKAYPTITSFIIGNEVNATRFWSPQHTSSDPNAGPDTYEAVLASCYDALKGFNPAIQVIGMGLAPRAVDSNSTAPLAFIRAVGAAYKNSGRTAPIMDALAVHPYPNPNASPPPAPDSATYDNPDFYGIPQLDRVKQAAYDAFNGTNQPTTLNGLKLVVDEIGYQSFESAGVHGYTGFENSPSVSEAQQATYYARIVQMYACDPSISAVLFFHLVDESNLNTTATSGGWQSGLEYPDGTPKPSFAAVKQAIAAGCTGPQVTWSPAGAVAAPSSAAPATQVTNYAALTAQFEEGLPAASVDGPVDDLLANLPADVVQGLVQRVFVDMLSPLVTQSTITFDPGLAFWRADIATQTQVVYQAYQLALPILGPDRTAGLQQFTLLLALVSAFQPNSQAVWNSLCASNPVFTVPFDCSGRALSSAFAGGRRSLVIAAARGRLAKGAPFRFAMKRRHAVVPGAYLTVLRVRSATNPKQVVLMASRPYLVTAADISAAQHRHKRSKKQ